MNGAAYTTRLAAEENAFRDLVYVHDLPGIFDYWSNQYVLPKLKAAGFSGFNAFFTDSLKGICATRAGSSARFLSIGAGNCDKEIEFAAELRSSGYTNFVIDCLDLNHSMLDRGKSEATAKGLGEHLRAIRADYNDWQPQDSYDGVIAIQSLHHIVNLEECFTNIREALKPGGRFLIADMIGRNGHLRWPEAATIVREYWRRLPPSYRYNCQLHRYEEMFEDWDCSKEGFEGVRSQDILPLLIEMFRFEVFIPYGNVIDPFLDRSFGPNFDESREWDRSFIDEIQQRDECEIARGAITPTHLFAIVGKDSSVPCRTVGSRTPMESLRLSSRENSEATASADPTQFWHPDLEPDLAEAGRQLADAEARIRQLKIEVDEWKVLLSKSSTELMERTDRAIRAEAQVLARTEWALGLEKLFEERTTWALKLELEAAEWRDYALHLERKVQRYESTLSGRLRRKLGSWRSRLRERVRRLSRA